MVDRLPEWQDWSSRLIQHRPLLSRVQFSRKTMNFQHSASSEECHIVHLNVISLVFASTSMSCKSVTSPKRQSLSMATEELAQKQISHFVTTFDLSQSSICYLSQFARLPQKSADHKGWQEKSQNLDIGRATWENGNVSPLSPIFHPFTNISRNCYLSKQGRLGTLKHSDIWKYTSLL